MGFIYQYQIITNPNSKIRGITPIQTPTLPTTIKLVEKYNEGNPSSLASLWKTICHTATMHTHPSKLQNYMELDHLIFNGFAERGKFNIVFYQASQAAFKYPDFEFWGVINKLTINPLEFLRLEADLREQQQNLIVSLLPFEETSEPLPYQLQHFTIEKNKLLFAGIDFTTGTALDRVRFSLAINLALKPSHKIIHISEYWLLNPIYLDSILNMISDHDYYLWITADPFPLATGR